MKKNIIKNGFELGSIEQQYLNGVNGFMAVCLHTNTSKWFDSYADALYFVNFGWVPTWTPGLCG